MRRWAKNGVLDRVFIELHVQNLIHVKIEAVQLDSTSVNVHPDGTGARKKGGLKPPTAREEGSTPKFIWLPRAREGFLASS